jgi:hypothetical protein
MPGVWDSMKKAAMAGAAHVAASAEAAARRLELQRRLGEQQAQLEAHYAAVGRLAVAAVRAGRLALPGAEAHAAAAEAAEAQVARLRSELDRLGS